ncbi:uncharacterized protein LOC101864041 isoform X2 [Aplysia californica]|uniref:Uncharacterized protein LOC101864041 isoform X2 n=1 Tax=Aplysia californica TaxID=6500 RepID=A0ABM0JCL9_APLCA|nr:uncharacterized protein LOC101864041 isoform X2 [Aplysia californica]
MSVDKEWSEALKACLANVEELNSEPSSSQPQDHQADNLPSSSLSPEECSPQPSPDSQHKDATPQSSQPGFSPLSQQDGSVSQSGVPPSSMAGGNLYQELSFHEESGTFENESHHLLEPMDHQIETDNNMYQSPGKPGVRKGVGVPSSQFANNSVMNTGPSHSQNLNSPEQSLKTCNQLLEQMKTVGRLPIGPPAPQNAPPRQPAFRMNNPGSAIHTGGQPSRLGFPRPTSPRHAALSPQQTGGRPHQPQQHPQKQMQQNPPPPRLQHQQQNPGPQQQHFQRRPQQQQQLRPRLPNNQMQNARHPANAVRMASANRNMGPVPGGRPGSGPPGQMQGAVGANRNGSNFPRGPGPGPGPAQTNMASGMKPPALRAEAPNPYMDPEDDDIPMDEEDMYYDDDEEDYDEDMEEDEEDFYEQYHHGPPPFHGPGGPVPPHGPMPPYQFEDSSDEDDVTDEEAALLEELSDCQDEERRKILIQQLHEKGVDPEDISYAEAEGHAFFESQTYFGEEQENAISSSSQPSPLQKQQPGQHPATWPAGVVQNVAHSSSAGFSHGQQTMQYSQQGAGPPSSQGSHAVSQPHSLQPRVPGQNANQARRPPPVGGPQGGNVGGPPNMRPQPPQGQMRPSGPRPQGPRFAGPSQSNPSQNIPGQQQQQPVSPHVQNAVRHPASTGAGRPSHPLRPPIISPMQTGVPRPQGIGSVAPTQAGGFARPQHAPLRSVRPRLPGRFAGQHRAPITGALDQEMAPSEAKLARLAVMHMQESLDREIMAKKGMPPSLAVSGSQTVRSMSPRMPSNIPHRFAHNQQQQHAGFSPHALQQRMGHPHNLHSQGFSPHPPRRQLSPRSPYPGSVNNNIHSPSSSTTSLSEGRPICSVVPFTDQNPTGQQANQSYNNNSAPQRSHPPPSQQQQQQTGNFVRPRNPAPNLQQCQTSSQFNAAQQAPTSQFPAAQRMSTSISGYTSTSSAAMGGPVMGRVPVPGSPAQSPTAPILSVQGSHNSQGQTLSQGQMSSQAGQLPPQQPQVSSAPPNSQNAPKSDSFSLDKLSEDKCIITGSGSKNQGLMPNMVYQIRSPLDNSLVLAVWTGERFQDLSEEDLNGRLANAATSTSGLPGQMMQTSTQAGSNVPNVASVQPTQQVPPRCSGTDGQATSSQDSSTTQAETGDTIAQNRQASEGSGQSTFVKPLPPQGGTQEKCPAQEEDDDDDDSIFKKPLSENEEHFRVCKLCGYTSRNFKRCEGCKRIFQGEVKIHSLKKNPAGKTTGTSASPSSLGTSSPSGQDSHPQGESWNKRSVGGVQNVMNSVSFYGNSGVRGRGRGARGGPGRTRGGGLKGRNGARAPVGEDYDSDSGDMDGLSSDGNSGNSLDGQGKRRAGRPKAKNPAPRKRSKKVDEPVTVTISSDEDEPSSTSNSMPGYMPSPAHSSGGESPVFPHLKSEPVNAFGRFRRARMQDEDGRSRLSKKLNNTVVPSPRIEQGEGEEEEDEEDEDDEEPPIYEIEIRSVRIGSMRTIAEGPLFMNVRGVCMKVKSESSGEVYECEILSDEVEKVKFCFGESQRVLFFFLTMECGEKLRSIFHMEKGDDEYFDPSSTDMRQKMVVVIIEDRDHIPVDMIRETISLWADINSMDDNNFSEELCPDSANDLLIQSAPPVLTHGAETERDVVKFKKSYNRMNQDLSNISGPSYSPSDSMDNEPDSTSSSPPEQKQLFDVPSVRLLQYPFPPARGIPITTEDLYCLTEGEFLNDVIIDFYLQYLYEEILNEENRKRTHIFSSFFYKRLTQRDRLFGKTEEDAKKSLPERRHARVKKWTKTVDLFSKDFIIVPINEHSHWYLAVICFPGLANPEVVPFIPSTVHGEDTEDDNTETGGSEDTPAEETNPEPLPKTILGKQLDPQKCIDNEESKYNLGQKQPCILMFDSLLGPSRAPNVRMLRDYLQCEWNAKKSEQRNIAKILRGSTPKVPQQSNYSDCGVFLLQYVESFFQDPIADFQIPMKGLQTWFPEELVLNKRREIHDLIMQLHRRFQEERGDSRVLEIMYESVPREPMPHKPGPSMAEMMPGPENLVPGMSRDDESSNSSVAGDMSKADFGAAAAMPMSQEEEEEGEEEMPPPLPEEATMMESQEKEQEEEEENTS